MIQKRAVKAIFPDMSYVDILNHINFSTLKERRVRNLYINLRTSRDCAFVPSFFRAFVRAFVCHSVRVGQLLR